MIIIVHAFFYETVQEPIKTHLHLHLFVFLGDMEENEDEKVVKKIIKKVEKRNFTLDNDEKRTLYAFYGDQYIHALGMDKDPNIIKHYIFNSLDLQDTMLYDLHALLHKHCIPEIYNRDVNTPLYVWHNMDLYALDSLNALKTTPKKTKHEISTFFHYKSHEKESFFASLYAQNLHYPVDPLEYINLSQTKRHFIHDHIQDNMFFVNHMYSQKISYLINTQSSTTTKTILFNLNVLPQYAFSTSTWKTQDLQQLISIYYPSEIFKKGFIPLYGNYIPFLSFKKRVYKNFLQLIKKHEAQINDHLQIHENITFLHFFDIAYHRAFILYRMIFIQPHLYLYSYLRLSPLWIFCFNAPL